MRTAKLFLLLVLSSIMAVSLKAQDTAWRRLQKLPDDTAKVNRVLAYVKTLFGKDHQKALRISEDALRLSKQLGYGEGIALAYRRMGYIHGQDGAFEEAIVCYRFALQYYGNNNLAGVLAVYNNLGANFKQLGKVDSSMNYYITGIEKIESANLEKESEATRLEILSTYALLNSNVSGVYSTMQNIPKALEYGEKAITAAKKINDTAKLVLAMVSVALIYEVDKDFRHGMNYAREAVRLAELQNDPMIRSKSYHLLSICYTGLHQPDSAIYAGERCMQYAKTSDRQLYITAFMDLAEAYDLKKAYKKEEALLLQALKELESINNMAFYSYNVYEKLAYAKYGLGDYKTAFNYYEKSIKYKDSALTKENRDAVSQLEAQYQAVQKEKALSEKQLQLAQKDLLLQKNRYYIFYSLTALVVALLVVALLFLRAKHKKRLHKNELKAIQQQKELQLLQALMQGEEKERNRIAKDLHDGVAGMLAAVKMHFSSMPAADELSNTEGYQQGMRLLNEATHEIRKTSHNLMPEVLLQHGLDEALRRYCNNVNNSRALKLQYDSWGDISRFADNFELSVYRIVQELVNNIIKHSRATQAMVQLNQQNDLLTLSIEDNGVGLSKTSGSEGMGLQSLQNRIKAMNGKLEITSSEQSGVSAYLEFEISALKKGIAV